MQQARILVTDDDTHVRYILAKYIRRLGYAVVEAESAEQALRILADKDGPQIDLMVADIRMPHMSGVELLQAARSINPDLPVAMITGAPSLDSSIAAVNFGAYAYLTKPIDNDQVREVIERGLTKNRELQELRTMQQKLLDRYEELEHRLSNLESQPSAPHSTSRDLLEELIRGLRHELGNTAAAIKLNLAVLEEDQTNSTNLRDHVTDLQASADHLVFLLGKLKEYPRHTLVTELIDLRHVLFSMEDEINEKDKRHKFRLIYAIPDNEILIQAAPLELGRAFVRVVENAIEAGEHGGECCVKVSAACDAQAVTVTISDDGPGFPNSMLEAPFSPGYTTKLNDGMVRGLGFGLFIARAIVELHSGRIWLENRPEGGASVYIQLPLAHAAQNALSRLRAED